MSLLEGRHGAPVPAPRSTEPRRASGSSPSGAPGNDAPHRRSLQARALGALVRLAGSGLVDRFGMRHRLERAVFHLTRGGMTAAGAVSRRFEASRRVDRPHRPGPAPSTDLIDLTPTPDQEMLVAVVRELAAEQLRPAAAEADQAARTPDRLVATAVEVGLWQLGVPDSLGGVTEHRSPVTNVLVAEALAHGDLGIAVACLAPAAVSTALALWGDADQQSRYLSPFVTDSPPRAALSITEPWALFDPLRLRTTAARRPDGSYRLDGVKSLVPAGDRAELLLVAAQVTGETGPALFVVESGTAGITVEPEPAMGLRAAHTVRVRLDDVRVPTSARLGTVAANPYRDCVRLSRLGWCALALGTAQAVVDHVIPYVNERVAFGEPISHRQSVAFTVADLATELEGMRLATYRAASRAEQGLDFSRETALAHRLCSRHGMAIGDAGVQLLGGHGFVKEHPVERWYRDLRAVAVLDGVVLV
jgi:alkylation response protein AidB-like acyl-CoA dehydrogenase